MPAEEARRDIEEQGREVPSVGSFGASASHRSEARLARRRRSEHSGPLQKPTEPRERPPRGSAKRSVDNEAGAARSDQRERRRIDRPSDRARGKGASRYLFDDMLTRSKATEAYSSLIVCGAYQKACPSDTSLDNLEISQRVQKWRSAKQ